MVKINNNNYVCIYYTYILYIQLANNDLNNGAITSNQ